MPVQQWFSFVDHCCPSGTAMQNSIALPPSSPPSSCQVAWSLQATSLQKPLMSILGSVCSWPLHTFPRAGHLWPCKIKCNCFSTNKMPLICVTVWTNYLIILKHRRDLLMIHCVIFLSLLWLMKYEYSYLNVKKEKTLVSKLTYPILSVV